MQHLPLRPAPTTAQHTITRSLLSTHPLLSSVSSTLPPTQSSTHACMYSSPPSAGSTGKQSPPNASSQNLIILHHPHCPPLSQADPPKTSWRAAYLSASSSPWTWAGAGAVGPRTAARTPGAPRSPAVLLLLLCPLASPGASGGECVACRATPCAGPTLA